MCKSSKKHSFFDAGISTRWEETKWKKRKSEESQSSEKRAIEQVEGPETSCGRVWWKGVSGVPSCSKSARDIPLPNPFSSNNSHPSPSYFMADSSLNPLAPKVGAFSFSFAPLPPLQPSCN